MADSEVSLRFTADTLVCDVVTDYPQTIPIFVRRRLYCPGCYMAPFHTLADSAREHDIPLMPLLRELNRAATSEDDGPRASPDGA